MGGVQKIHLDKVAKINRTLFEIYAKVFELMGVFRVPIL